MDQSIVLRNPEYYIPYQQGEKVEEQEMDQWKPWARFVWSKWIPNIQTDKDRILFINHISDTKKHNIDKWESKVEDSQILSLIFEAFVLCIIMQIQTEFFFVLVLFYS